MEILRLIGVLVVIVDLALKLDTLTIGSGCGNYNRFHAGMCLTGLSYGAEMHLFHREYLHFCTCTALQ